MTAISRRSLVAPISIPFTLATADDLDGTDGGTQWFDVTGAARVLIWQIDDGTAGTAGIDVLEVSHDEGKQWVADLTVLPVAQNDTTGTIKAAGALNAAGIEPATIEVGLFKCGPYEGPTLIKIARDTSGRGLNGTGTDWVSGAPTVLGMVVGLTSGLVAAEA